MPTLARIWLPIAFGAALAYASDVAVVVDVSGTMGRYGKWQPDALDLIEAITSGTPATALKFSSTGDPQSTAQFKLAPGEGLVLLKFGSVQSDAYPFFSSAQRVASAAELRGVFPNTAAAFREKMTNKELALAVGARLAGNSPARMIVISDFLSDADLTQQQQQYINQFESQTRLDTPVIYTWLTDNRVLVKLMVANSKAAPPPTTTENPPPTEAEKPKTSDHQIQILDARLIEGSPSRYQFRWRLTPAGNVKGYRLTLRDAKTRKIVLEQPGLASPAVSILTPAPGDYFAQVTADLEDGSEAASRPYPVKIEGNYGGVIFAIFALAAIVAALWFFIRRSNQRKTNTDKREVRR
ncbi:MAG TPA: hypothetical protein VGL53_00205 [Bryobacteraceae bacterium]|jgi:hypothetical protein